MTPTEKLHAQHLYDLAMKARAEQTAYYSRALAVPAASAIADPDAPPAYTLPDMTVDHRFGEVHPDPASLKAMGQQFAPEPLVDVAPAPLLDTSMVAGTHTPRPRENISPFRTDTMER
jgi:hypothetical protein